MVLLLFCAGGGLVVVVLGPPKISFNKSILLLLFEVF